MKPQRPIVFTSARIARIAFFLWLVVGTTGFLAWAATDPGPDIVHSALLLYSVLSLIGLAFSGFFSGSETAFLSANRIQLEALAAQGHRGAQAALSVMKPRERTQASILLGTNLANVIATASSLKLLDTLTPGLGSQWRDLTNTLVMTPLVLLVGEVLPKAIARANPDRILMRVSPALIAFDWVLRPIAVVVLSVSLVLMRLTGQKGEPQIITREDLRRMAEMGESEGVLEQDHRRMIHAVLDLNEQRVESVMRPLSEVVTVEEGTSVEEYMTLVESYGYSRLPVYRERVDNIVGLVYILDVIYAEETPETIDPFIRRELLFVPETKRVATLLTELRFRRSPMAFVVDEYGGVVGLVTMEDLVEEIVGEIRDERDEETEEVEINERTMTVECDGKTEIDALNEELARIGVAIPEGDYETIAGFVIHQLDRIPQVSDVVETEDLMVIVLAADARSVQRVKVIAKRPRTRKRAAKKKGSSDRKGD